MKPKKTSRAASLPVMWGEYKVKNYCGPVDFSKWDFGEETPWLCCEKDGFQVVTPNWAYTNDGMDCMSVGISFIAMIERYKETFLDYEEEDGERKRAIANLKKAISILEQK